MAAFNTKKTLNGPSALISEIASQVESYFKQEGYEVQKVALSSGGYDISITKGGLFKAVLGMKTALKVTLLPVGNGISFEAGVGSWGQQAIPTIISMLFFWPVLITQIWGMIEQSSLDDKALEIAEKVIAEQGGNTMSFVSNEYCFCTACGTKNPIGAKFCCGCGKEL